MESKLSKIALVCSLGLVFALWPGLSPGSGARQGPAAPLGGLEVLNGSYSCSGSIYTDEQPPNVSILTYMSATSGITNNFFSNGFNDTDVPADLVLMGQRCDDHVGAVRAQLPQICVSGPLIAGGGEFGNGESVGTHFDFSCEGGRDPIVHVIGTLSRAPLLEAQP